MNEFHLILSNPHFACRLGNRKAKFKLIQTLEFPIGSKDYPPLGNRKLALINKSTPMTENELTYFKLMAASNKTSKAKYSFIPRLHHTFEVVPRPIKDSSQGSSIFLSLTCTHQPPPQDQPPPKEQMIEVVFTLYTRDMTEEDNNLETSSLFSAKKETDLFRLAL